VVHAGPRESCIRAGERITPTNERLHLNPNLRIAHAEITKLVGDCGTQLCRRLTTGPAEPLSLYPGSVTGPRQHSIGLGDGLLDVVEERELDL
jgi:hypothetical protein